MSYVHPAWVEHQRKRFTRADAYRLAPPGSPEAKPPGWLDPSATRVRLKEATEDEARACAAAEQDAFEREVEALRAANARVRIELADVKFTLALRRIFHKYSPDQPRDERGRWTDSGRENPGDGSGQLSQDATGSSQSIRVAELASPTATATDASPLPFSPDKPGWHNYRLGPNIACAAEFRCSREEMTDQFARFSLPGRDPSMPIEDGKTYPVYIPGTDRHVGDVDTEIKDDGLTIENRTKEGHIFFDGVVVRTLRQSDDGAWYVTTHGFGNNVRPGTNVVNQLVGPEVFNELDRQMRANIERHHGKGILDLAVYRVDGGGHPRARHAVVGARHEIA